ncbi:FHA domain-containing protein [Nocardia sp. NPDC046763]|uniref:FHA domain-containing protein n=1 Tax=Nocardia sp. NPDC046763 TaxID=3155256 RepID=UPI0033F051E0
MSESSAPRGAGNEVECANCHERVPRTLQCRNCGHNLFEAPAPPPVEPEVARALDSGVELVVESGARLRIRTGQTLGLGRHEDFPAAVVFEPYTNVSRFHGELRYDGERLYITDTSTNGTFINDVRIPENIEHAIGRSDTLRLAADVPITIEWGP